MCKMYGRNCLLQVIVVNSYYSSLNNGFKKIIYYYDIMRHSPRAYILCKTTGLYKMLAQHVNITTTLYVVGDRLLRILYSAPLSAPEYPEK